MASKKRSQSTSGKFIEFPEETSANRGGGACRTVGVIRTGSAIGGEDAHGESKQDKRNP